MEKPTRKIIPTEQIKEIQKECEQLTGTLYHRSGVLGSKYGYNRITIRNHIKDLPCMTQVKSAISEEEKKQIKKLFEDAEHPVLADRYKHVAYIVNRSAMSIRNVILGKEEEKEPKSRVKYYSPQNHPFY